MNRQAHTAIALMLDSFGQSQADRKGLLLTFEAGLRDVTDEAICETAHRYVSGKADSQNLSFAPSVAQFCSFARSVMEAQELRARPRLPHQRYQSGTLAPFEITYQRKLAENSHLPVIKSDVSFDEWRRMSAAREIPVGARWIAATGIVYGPKP